MWTQLNSSYVFVSAARQQEEEGGSRKMGVHLPAVRPPEEEEEVMEASVSAVADSDSSTSDGF